MALWHAVMSGTDNEIWNLLMHDVDVEEIAVHAPDTQPYDDRGQDACTPLQLAVLYCKLNAVRMLLSKGANPHQVGIRGNLLHVAIWTHEPDRLEIIRVLLEYGIDVNGLDEDGATPLHIAALLGVVDISRVLIRGGSDLSAGDNQGRTALHYSAMIGYGDIARLLISNGSDIYAQDDNGNITRDTAVRSNHIGVVEAIDEEIERLGIWTGFAMGHHPRLGRGTFIHAVEPEILRMILTATQEPVT
jgi:hypothetical protein